MSWATKRRIIYGGGAFIFLLLICTAVFYAFLYKAPSCTDGRQNGNETGIDCGGSCPNLCVNDTLPPIVLWAKAFSVSGNVWSAMAYVENPNVSSRNDTAAYQFDIYDENNSLIGSRTGVISLPKNKQIGIFEPGFVFTNSVPKRVDFKFTSFGPWLHDTASEPSISTTNSALSSTSTTPRIDGTITNNSLKDVGKVEITAIVLDGNENAVAASRTFIDSLPHGTSQDFVFAWPKPFDLGVEACVNPIDVALALDVSGSMRSDSQNPPEPWTTVKVAAANFLKMLTGDDKASLVVFGNTATTVSMMTSDKSQVINEINNLNLSTTSENTNIGDGLATALQTMGGNPVALGGQPVVILLTDGVPTAPTGATAGYPAIYAEQVASSILKSGVTIYTIGLGKNVNSGLLETLAGNSSRYISSPTKDVLSGAYASIRAALCTKKPNTIIIGYRIVTE